MKRGYGGVLGYRYKCVEFVGILFNMILNLKSCKEKKYTRSVCLTLLFTAIGILIYFKSHPSYLRLIVICFDVLYEIFQKVNFFSSLSDLLVYFIFNNFNKTWYFDDVTTCTLLPFGSQHKINIIAFKPLNFITTNIALRSHQIHVIAIDDEDEGTAFLEPFSTMRCLYKTF